MLISEKDRSYLWDITQACEDILNFVKDISRTNLVNCDNPYS